ncbi:MAG TPA: SpoIIE family protein phosphatase [Verrucomicrobiae bacterium]|jgi:serine phosphatase RsbU (regulator of sigma subunit)|nr:SpoIIE family protein phosphatase [Verrucomicrobiae bacterium]
MSRLVIANGSEAGTSFALAGPESVIGRQTGTEIKLNGTNVSRRHARIFRDGEGFLIEDLKSSNGTFLNGVKLQAATPLKARDEIRVGPYVLRFEAGEQPAAEVTIHVQTAANTANLDLYRENAAHKLQIILQLSADLGRSLDVEHLLAEVLKHLFGLFPHAERGLVILVESGHPVLRASKNRSGLEERPRYSNSILQKVLAEGVAVFAEDLQSDSRFAEAKSICSLGLRSFMCVPLKAKSGKAFGVLQLERMGSGHRFAPEDLNLLTAIGLQVSVVLENAQLHLELLARHRIERDLALAREIQLSYLPTQIPELPDRNFDLHAELFPAHEISGDFYDYFKVGDRLALAVADVSGKGMPAALFMSMVRALLRNFADPGKDAGTILRDLNNAIAEQNPKCQFVTLSFCLFDPVSRAIELSSGGHPLPFLRRGNGTVETIEVKQGPLLGFEAVRQAFPSARFELAPNDLLLLYTDGVTEAPRPDHSMFGSDRLRKTLAETGHRPRLIDCAERIRQNVHAFTGGGTQDDDITLAMLRCQ